MSFAVHLVRDAEEDLVSIHRYIATNDAPERADHVLDNLLETCGRLETLPGRGHIPPELQRIGVTEYREIHWGPYRVVYEVLDEAVHVHAIVDGRRELQALLAERLYR